MKYIIEFTITLAGTALFIAVIMGLMAISQGA